MKLLFMVIKYPAEDDFYLFYFVHPRVLGYIAAGHEVEVVSLTAKESYYFENIRVLSKKEWFEKRRHEQYDAVIAHSPGIKKHGMPILRRQNQFKKIVLVFNGAEAMRRYKYNIDCYAYQKKRFYFLRHKIQYLIDYLRVYVFKIFILYFLLRRKIKIILTSAWLQKCFLHDIGIKKDVLQQHMVIIPNPVGDAFLKGNYQPAVEKYADFITIRPLSEYRYAMDAVWNIARQNKDHTFHIYGKGDFFEHYEILPNMKIFPRFIKNADIPGLLDHYRAALMPTRSDGQGVMVTEMATYGMPLITSDIEIAHAVLAGFKNVAFIDNDRPKLNATDFFREISYNSPAEKRHYAHENTYLREMKYIEGIIDE
ncbi:glycosyltransferase [candidate division FCPU426 bacterium]|nr:glycosyltransferase [candidate division FCPU426 bacterium]